MSSKHTGDANPSSASTSISTSASSGFSSSSSSSSSSGSGSIPSSHSVSNSSCTVPLTLTPEQEELARINPYWDFVNNRMGPNPYMDIAYIAQPSNTTTSYVIPKFPKPVPNSMAHAFPFMQNPHALHPFNNGNPAPIPTPTPAPTPALPTHVIGAAPPLHPTGSLAALEAQNRAALRASGADQSTINTLMYPWQHPAGQADIPIGFFPSDDTQQVQDEMIRRTYLTPVSEEGMLMIKLLPHLNAGRILHPFESTGKPMNEITKEDFSAERLRAILAEAEAKERQEQEQHKL